MIPKILIYIKGGQITNVTANCDIEYRILDGDLPEESQKSDIYEADAIYPNMDLTADHNMINNH